MCGLRSETENCNFFLNFWKNKSKYPQNFKTFFKIFWDFSDLFFQNHCFHEKNKNVDFDFFLYKPEIFSRFQKSHLEYRASILKMRKIKNPNFCFLFTGISMISVAFYVSLPLRLKVSTFWIPFWSHFGGAFLQNV